MYSNLQGFIRELEQRGDLIRIKESVSHDLEITEIADRTVKRRVLIAGIVLYALAGSSGLYLSSLNTILAGRLALGVAVGMVMTTAIALIADLYEGADRAKVLGWQAASMGLGGVLFVGSGGILGTLGWRGPFAMYLVPLLLLPIVLRAIPALPPRPPTPETGTGDAFPWAHALPIYLLAAASMLTFYVIPTLMPFVIAELVGVDRAALFTGMAVAVATFASAVASMQFARLRARLSPPAIAALSFAFVAAGYFFVSTGPSYAPLVAALGVIGAALGIMMPNNNAWLLSRIPDAVRGRASGGMTSAVFLAQFSSAFVGAGLREEGGLDFVYLAMSGFAALIGALMLAVALRWSRGETTARR